MLRRLRLALAFVVPAAAYGFGVLSHEHRWFPTPQIESGLRGAIWLLRPERGYRDTSDRTPVDCGSLRGAAVWLTLGQSNAANEGDLDYTTGAGVFNLNPFDGKCYVARDPLLGTTGDRGSVWTRAADGAIAAGLFDRVVVLPIAVGGSSITRWSSDGDLYPRLELARQALADAGLRATHVLWHQGESDVLMPAAEYRRHFASMLDGLRAAGIDAPVYVAQVSLCKNHGSETLRQAQRDLTELPGVRLGPDTDTLDRFLWRRDMCHFSAAGLQRHAALWVETLRRDHRVQD